MYGSKYLYAISRIQLRAGSVPDEHKSKSKFIKMDKKSSFTLPCWLLPHIGGSQIKLPSLISTKVTLTWDVSLGRKSEAYNQFSSLLGYLPGDLILFEKNLCIYLAVPGVSHSTLKLRSSLQHAGSLVAAGELRVSGDMWDPVPWPGIKLGPPALGVRVLATGPLGKPHQETCLCLY